VDEFEYSKYKPLVRMADLSVLSWRAWLACAGLGFSLSFLFFMDQNITSAIVNNPQMK
jgi:sodium borate transporter 11